MERVERKALCMLKESEWNNNMVFAHTVTDYRIRVEEYMKHQVDKKKQEQINEQSALNKFNSITEKAKPENQNQQHNVREEGIGPINQKK